jgi:hypothetical protein
MFRGDRCADLLNGCTNCGANVDMGIGGYVSTLERRAIRELEDSIMLQRNGFARKWIPKVVCHFSTRREKLPVNSSLNPMVTPSPDPWRAI